MFENEINKQRIDTMTYKLTYEFCEVLSYDGKKKTTNIKFITRPGTLVDCLILGNLTPKAGDKGIIFFVGKYNTPVFKNFNNFQTTNFVKAGEVRKESYKNVPPLNSSGLATLYVFVHSWSPAISQNYYSKKTLKFVFKKGGGNISEAIVKAKEFSPTVDGDCLILLGLNDIPTKAAVNKAIDNLQSLITIIRGKGCKGNILVCDAAAQSNWSNFSNVELFNSNLSSLKDCTIISTLGYIQSQKYEFTDDKFHLKTWNGLAKYIASFADN